jgi:putative membrane protein
MALGIALALTLLLRNDLRGIGETLLGVGWWILLIAALHLPQILFAVLGWRALFEKPRPGLWLLFRIRWVRDSVNTLLPVAKLGGDVVRIRLLSRRGVRLPIVASSTVVDVFLEVATQIAFTLGAVILLLASSQAEDVSQLALGTCAGAVVVAGILIAGQRLGALKLVERLAARGGVWSRLNILSGLHAEVGELCRHPKRIFLSAGFHFTAWFLGTFETFAAMELVGLHAVVREALIIEALGHAVRAAGLAIPGAMGVQEGGYLVICAIFGIGPEQALALALIHRIREVILGAPGLLLWHRMEQRRTPVEAA